MAFQPGLAGSQFPGEDYILRELKDLRRAVQELSAADPFAPMGMTPSANAVTFGGSVNINGNLSVPNGSISNAALTDPLVISDSGVSQNNFATTTAGAVYASATVTVPAGYARADVLCMVVGGAINSAAVADYIYVASSINGVPGGETPQPIPASGGYGSAAANGIRSLTGLNGGTITVGCQIRTGNVWAASTSNFANMNAVIFFRR